MNGLLLVDGGLSDCMSALLAAWLTTLRIGLYAVELPRDRTLTIDDIVPCDFPGYLGLRDLTAWHAPELIGQRDVVTHADIEWIHNSDPGSSWCWGYYVVNRSNALIWFEPSFSVPKLLADDGAFAKVSPRFSLRNEV